MLILFVCVIISLFVCVSPLVQQLVSMWMKKIQRLVKYLCMCTRVRVREIKKMKRKEKDRVESERVEGAWGEEGVSE